ncbi:hypothetical protein [Candidatus Sororendozoicomonas aggregata]|uniref:hypothetical protein n=1 Tax=Candidatus Sororendozoicomonas aggregata TaxID=3073239 RepID=UPI002ED210A9
MKTFYLWAGRALKYIMLFTLFLPTISHSIPSFVFWYDGKSPKFIKEGDLGIVFYGDLSPSDQRVQNYYFGRIEQNKKKEWMCLVKDPSGFQKKAVYLKPIASLSLTPEVIQAIAEKLPSGFSQIRGSELLDLVRFKPLDGTDGINPPSYEACEQCKELNADQQLKLDAAQFIFTVEARGGRSKVICHLANNDNFTFSIYPGENKWDRLARENPESVIEIVDNGTSTFLFYTGCAWVKKDGKNVTAKKYSHRSGSASEQFQLKAALKNLRVGHKLETSGYVAIDGMYYAGGEELDRSNKGEGANRAYRILPPGWQNQ